MPKRLPDQVGGKHLAIAVEDHPLEFGDFEGTIPEGECGAGTVEIWDRGTYEEVEWTDNSIVIMLHGKRVNGTFNLIRFQKAGERQ